MFVESLVAISQPPVLVRLAPSSMCRLSFRIMISSVYGKSTQHHVMRFERSIAVS
jgi:hypothetical protein